MLESQVDLNSISSGFAARIKPSNLVQPDPLPAWAAVWETKKICSSAKVIHISKLPYNHFDHLLQGDGVGFRTF